MNRTLALRVVAAIAVMLAADQARGASADVASPTVRAAAPVADQEPAPPLKLMSSVKKGPRLSELEFSTPYLPANPRVRVLTPIGYDKAPGKRWPVLWLLHGINVGLPGSWDGYTRWTDNYDAEAVTRQGRFLVVMPEAAAGHYADHYNSGLGGPKWQSFHLRQLLPWIDAHYRTIPTRAARAIAGLSMGGGGAMQYAARHPDLFSFTESYSGAVNPNGSEPMLGVRSTDINQALSVAMDGSAPYSAFGPWATEEVRTRAHATIDLIGNLRSTRVTLRTANGTNEQGVPVDAEEAGVWFQTVDLHEAMDKAGLPHTFEDAGPGGHTAERFAAGLRKGIAPFNAWFASGAGKVPASFSYTWAWDRADMYDYHVTSDRGFLEFATLDVAPGWLALSGSGTFTLTTPGQYAPGARYRLTSTRNGLQQQAVVKADAKGRLSFTVDMGRRSLGQQYRPVDGVTVANQVQIAIRRA